MKKVHLSMFAVSLLMVSSPVLAESTVIIRQVPMVVVTEQIPGDFEGRVVEINASQNLIIVHDANGRDRQVAVQGALDNYRLGDYVQIRPAAAPMIVTRTEITGDFEGRITQVNYTQNMITINDTNGRDRQVSVKPEIINNYRVGDYVQIRPMTDLTVITIEENPRDFEGEVTGIDGTKGRIVVLDTNGRERKFQLKQGTYNNYKVDDYVRVHLSSDLRDALTIKTLNDVRNLEGRIITIDAPRSWILVRGTNGKENAVFVRQGQIQNYRVGDQVRIYTLENLDQVQTIRVIR